MHGHDRELAVLADENSGRRAIERVRWMDDGRRPLYRVTTVASVAEVRWWRIEPSAARGVKQPTTVVIRSPTPRLIASKCPAETGIPHPLAHGERGPTKARTEGPPAIAVSSARRPSAVRIKIGVTGRVIGSTRVLKRSVCCRGNRIDAAGDPMVEIIAGGKPANVH